MKGFDSYLQRAQVQEWSQHYVGYASLKDRVRFYRKRRRAFLKKKGGGQHDNVIELAPSSSSKDDDNDGMLNYHLQQDYDNEDPEQVQYYNQMSMKERNEFRAQLQQELHKATKWYQECLVSLRQRIIMTDDEEASSKDLEELGILLLNLYSFCVVNIITVRQTLLRYDAYVRTYDGCVLSELDMQHQQQDSQQSLFGFLEQLQSWLSLELMASKQVSSLEKPQTQSTEMEALLDKTFLGMDNAAGGHWTKRDRLLSTLRQHFLVGALQFGISLEPEFLSANGRHFKREMKALAQWRETKRLEPEAYQEQQQDPNQMDPANIWPLCLNLISCFLFMMNNYIIEPSSAYYANALGASDALSGIMIGATPWLALVSAIGYSIWTNTSYKAPILFAGVLMVIGNTLYASAYSFQSMEVCLIGRAIQGLGAPRIINRRYIADATPFALRTISSAAFSLTTALGAALGPGVAIVLDMIPEFEFDLPFLGTQYFNGMTGPGFFMALLWFLYSLAVLFTFQEPNRSGLEELKRREEEMRMAESEGMSPRLDSFRDDDDDDDISSADTSTCEEQHDTDKPVSRNSPLYCIKYMTRATALCMSLIFMKRVALETIVASTSVITKNRYGWSIQNVGTLHLVNGLIVIPISIFAGWLSQYYEDRFLATWFMAVTAIGMVFLVDPTDLFDHESSTTYNYDAWWSVGPINYIVGSMIAFSGIESCESFVASLMSKCVPSALAVGTFNSGLLATLVGTGGRAVGDLFITAMGLLSIRNLLNLLIIPGLALMLLSMCLLRRNYNIVAV